MKDLAAAAKARARAAGADLVGIAPTQALPDAQAYEAWIARGMQGTMDYMADHAQSRGDAARWYPEAKSALLCGFSYWNPGKPAQTQPGTGRLARYSVLPDYHDALKERLNGVLAGLKSEFPGLDGVPFVDSSPLLERAFARHAGLGWVGKNTMLLSQSLGSYFFLCGIALNAELPADGPVADHCGGCTRCLDACPTDAFPKERVLDASRCIAYLTIEHRGPIPEGLRPGVGDWVMGCDVCQEVCPWNRFSRQGIFAPLEPTQVGLNALAGLDQAGFKRRYGKTPVRRAKRAGIIRNALLAMGNSGDPCHRATLKRYLKDPDPVIREQASWSLARLDALDKTEDVGHTYAPVDRAAAAQP